MMVTAAAVTSMRLATSVLATMRYYTALASLDSSSRCA